MRRSTSKAELDSLYLDERLSTKAIGEKLGWSEGTIAEWLKAFGIPLRQRRNLSRYGLECRPRRVACPKYDFDGGWADKAYLIGLRLGDLHVYKPSSTSGIIVVRGHSTIPEQHELFKRLFERYGRVWQGKVDNRNAVNAYAYLNQSFDFLLPKEDRVEAWIQDDGESSAAFVAGYVDAEGTFGVYEGRARFKLDSQDQNILTWVHRWLQSNRISCPSLHRIACAGEWSNAQGYRLRRDVWRITINRADSLLKFIGLIQPFLKHAKRRRDMLKALENVSNRSGVVLE